MDEIFKPLTLKSLINDIFVMNKNNQILQKQVTWQDSLKKFKEIGAKFYPNEVDWENLTMMTNKIINEINSELLEIYDKCVEIAEKMYFPKNLCYVDLKTTNELILNENLE